MGLARVYDRVTMANVQFENEGGFSRSYSSQQRSGMIAFVMGRLGLKSEGSARTALAVLSLVLIAGAIVFYAYSSRQAGGPVPSPVDTMTPEEKARLPKATLEVYERIHSPRK